MPFEIGLPNDLLVAGLAIAVAMICILLIFKVQESKGPYRPQPLLTEHRQIAFLFDGPNLLDATPEAFSIIRASGARSPGLTEISRLLEPRFPGITQALQQPSEEPQTILSHGRPDHMATCEMGASTLRLEIRSSSGGNTAIHPLAMAAIKDEQTTFRQVEEHAPTLTWKTDADGMIVWANRSYLATADQIQPPVEDLTSDWPPTNLFPREMKDDLPRSAITRRARLEQSDSEKAQWYDVTTAPVADGCVHFATDAGRLVQAELQAKQFVQTLTKTFAHLPIGLAIFDGKCKLVMFNPALSDLTQLSPTFLTSKPEFGHVLERLREQGILPAPKTYANWREQVSRLETEARAGTYAETWTLPSGETYRVTGRPHPDGAFALLLEDITSEITLTRSFRVQIETASAVIDQVDEAISVFSPAGTLMLSNTAYRSAWSSGLGASDDSTLSREMGHWRSIVAPTPFWQALHEFSAGVNRRDGLETTIYRPNGQIVALKAKPIVGGAMLISFRTLMPGQPLPTPVLAAPLQEAQS